MKKIQTNYGGEKLIFVYRKWGGGCHNRTTSRIVPPRGLETLIIETSFPGKLTDKEVLLCNTCLKMVWDTCRY